jgi:hypothetical protein
MSRAGNPLKQKVGFGVQGIREGGKEERHIRIWAFLWE